MDDHIKIVKPKKCIDNGTYEGKIYIQNNTGKKKDIVLQIQNINIISKKVSQKDLYICLRYKNSADKKSKRELIDKICDINSKVLQYVKDNCASWFRNTITDDLIEDYYSNIISYDKTLGQIYKFKLINPSDSIDDSILNKLVNIKIKLRNIRFFKQKFVLEWIVEEIEILQDTETFDTCDDDALSDNEDIPYPLQEDICNLKKEYTCKLMEHIKRLDRERSEFQEAIHSISGAMEFSILSKILEDIDNMLETAATK